jgi:hypothetical protein
MSAVGPTIVDLVDLGLDRGGHLLLKHALSRAPVGGSIEVLGRDPALPVHLRGWARAQGHEYNPDNNTLTRGGAQHGRWRGASRAGSPGLDGVVEQPDSHWGLAARGALVEAGGPDFNFPLSDKATVWTEDAGRLYERAMAAQWDPNVAIPWETKIDLPDEVEDAVVQVMTYLIENEVAALLVPARFLANIHPHFSEILQLLAVQAADEARHIHVFTRRAMLVRDSPGLSTVGGQTSLKTLLDEPDFALAMFLLSVLGEGTFLSLLWFLAEHAPDPITREIAKLTAQDEARHVAFGLAHLQEHIEREPGYRTRMANAIHQRFHQLQHTAGLNEEVFDALVLLAAGSWQLDDIRRGFDLVTALKADMDKGRRGRLARLGFSEADATELSSLHTRNFM